MNKIEELEKRIDKLEAQAQIWLEEKEKIMMKKSIKASCEQVWSGTKEIEIPYIPEFENPIKEYFEKKRQKKIAEMSNFPIKEALAKNQANELFEIITKHINHNLKSQKIECEIDYVGLKDKIQICLFNKL